MHFTKDRLARLRRSLELALNQEWPQLSATRKKLTRHLPKRILSQAGANALPVIATVATDGGENRLNLEPIRLQIMRVADSLGEISVAACLAHGTEAQRRKYLAGGRSHLRIGHVDIFARPTAIR